jgi:capsular polysaccharide biosynthesis protein
MSKREEARISDDLDRRRILNVSVVQAPTLPVLPRRSPLVVALGGILAAFALSIGTALVSEYLDDSLRTPQAIQGSLNLPVLAVFVPETRLLGRGSTDVTSHE